MKAHGPKAGSKNRPRSELEPVATINDVVQEEVIVAGLSLPKSALSVGTCFTNLDSSERAAPSAPGGAGQPQTAVGRLSDWPCRFSSSSFSA